MLCFSVTGYAAAETEFSEGECTTTEYGNAVLIDSCDLLSDFEESNLLDTILTAVETKNISVGIISTKTIKQEVADFYYTLVAESDTDFALMLFNEDEYSYYFYGSADAEFANDDDAFWMTEIYLDGDAYFAVLNSNLFIRRIKQFNSYCTAFCARMT